MRLNSNIIKGTILFICLLVVAVVWLTLKLYSVDKNITNLSPSDSTNGTIKSVDTQSTDKGLLQANESSNIQNNAPTSTSRTPRVPVPSHVPIPPPITSTCVWDDIPFEYEFIKGTEWSFGINGTRETCTYSDGNVTSEVVIEPRNEIVAIWKFTQDEAVINSICSRYPQEYYETCKAVVIYDPSSN